jgi:hypothetical protein
LLRFGSNLQKGQIMTMMSIVEQLFQIFIVATLVTRSLSFAVPNPKASSNPSITTSSSRSPIYHHHTAIRTRNIENAIKFYSLFGYQVETKFRAGPARAAWLVNNGSTFTSSNKNKDDDDDDDENNDNTYNAISSRLEIIEVPSYVLQEREGTVKRAIDLIENEALLGINHYALDVTSYIRSLHRDDYYGLDQYLDDVNEVSKERFGKTLRIAKKPYQKAIGNQVFELCFLYDADGCIMELVRYIKDLDQSIQSGWEPWDGTGFVGVSE